MYSFWAFVEALGLIATLILLVAPLDGRKRCEPIGWHDAVFLAQQYYLDADTKY
jgi:hypothetical protein